MPPSTRKTPSTGTGLPSASPVRGAPARPQVPPKGSSGGGALSPAANPPLAAAAEDAQELSAGDGVPSPATAVPQGQRREPSPSSGSASSSLTSADSVAEGPDEELRLILEAIAQMATNSPPSAEQTTFVHECFVDDPSLRAQDVQIFIENLESSDTANGHLSKLDPSEVSHDFRSTGPQRDRLASLKAFLDGLTAASVAPLVNEFNTDCKFTPNFYTELHRLLGPILQEIGLTLSALLLLTTAGVVTEIWNLPPLSSVQPGQLQSQSMLNRHKPRAGSTEEFVLEDPESRFMSIPGLQSVHAIPTDSRNRILNVPIPDNVRTLVSGFNDYAAHAMFNEKLVSPNMGFRLETLSYAQRITHRTFQLLVSGCTNPQHRHKLDALKHDLDDIRERQQLQFHSNGVSSAYDFLMHKLYLNGPVGTTAWLRCRETFAVEITQDDLSTVADIFNFQITPSEPPSAGLRRLQALRIAATSALNADLSMVPTDRHLLIIFRVALKALDFAPLPIQGHFQQVIDDLQANKYSSTARLLKSLKALELSKKLAPVRPADDVHDGQPSTFAALEVIPPSKKKPKKPKKLKASPPLPPAPTVSASPAPPAPPPAVPQPPTKQQPLKRPQAQSRVLDAPVADPPPSKLKPSHKQAISEVLSGLVNCGYDPNDYFIHFPQQNITVLKAATPTDVFIVHAPGLNSFQRLCLSVIRTHSLAFYAKNPGCVSGSGGCLLPTSVVHRQQLARQHQAQQYAAQGGFLGASPQALPGNGFFAHPSPQPVQQLPPGYLLAPSPLQPMPYFAHGQLPQSPPQPAPYYPSGQLTPRSVSPDRSGALTYVGAAEDASSKGAKTARKQAAREAEQLARQFHAQQDRHHGTWQQPVLPSAPPYALGAGGGWQGGSAGTGGWNSYGPGGAQAHSGFGR